MRSAASGATNGALRRSSRIPRQAEAKRDGRGVGAGQRLLLVDDNEDALRSLEKLLGVLGFEVRCATSGREALEAGAVLRPDAVLLDLGMPVMDGFETAAAIRREPWGKAVRIIAVTGWGQPEDVRKTKAAGFAGHLVKPLQTKELLKLLGH